MPVRHEIDVDAGLVLVDISGALTSAEALGFLSALAADPAVRPGLAVLGDCRRVTSGPSFLELHRIATAWSALPDDVRPRRAAALVNKGWLFGFVRQFAAIIDHLGVCVMPFLTVEDAHRWLSEGDDLSLSEGYMSVHGTPDVELPHAL